MSDLPNGWKQELLSDYLETIIDYRGKTPEKADKGILTLSAKSVKMGEIDYSQAYFISKETYKEFMVRGFPKIGDILMTTEAPLGCIAKLDRDDVSVAQRLLTLRGKEGQLDNDYLMYYLMSPVGQYELLSRASGSTVQGIKRSEFEKINIILPNSYSEQKQIANILSSFDKKIELLKEQNQTLETMAQTIFLDFFNRSTNLIEVTLGELVNIKYGKDHKHLKNGSYPLYGSGGVMRYVEGYLYDKESILIPRKGTLGNLFFVQKAFWSVDTIFYTEIDDTKIFPIYLYYQLKRFNFENLNVGSAVPSLTTNVLNALKLEIPNLDSQKEIVYILKSLNSKSLNNLLQIKTLEETRNSLLLKLMSGRIRVNNA